MRFSQPLLLLLLPLVGYFAYLGRPTGRHGRGRAWAALTVRALLVAAVVLALAGAQTVHGGDQLAIVYLLDVSDSVPETEQERGLQFVRDGLAALSPGDRAALVLFGADALVERPLTSGGELGPVASIPRTEQSDLAAAIRLGVALLPEGAARRLVLLSDGRPTVGEAEQAVRLARAQGVEVDVVPLNGPLQAGEMGRVEAWLTDLAAPARVHQGEQFDIAVTARATHDVEAVLTVVAGDRMVTQETVHLNPGGNTFAIPFTAAESGFLSFRAYLAPTADTYPQNNSLAAFTLVSGPPRVLLVAAAPEETAYLRDALRSAGLTVVESSPAAMPSDAPSLAEYNSVVLVNTPARDFSARALESLQSYVRDLGGGLVAVGGPRAYGVGGWYDTPLEETLPVEMTVHDRQRFPPLAVVVVIDKSGSMGAMEGNVTKIRLAGEAAARVAELLHDDDEITVIAFDDRPADVIGPLPAARRAEVIDKVTRLQAGGGGIYVRESLQEALRYLSRSDRPVRHIILLADGSDSEHQGGVRQLVEDEIAAQNITLSTVAIGAGSDLHFLEDIAALGGGRYHFTDRAGNLPVIFAEEIQLAMRSYIVEESFYPRQTAVSPILEGITAVPQLAGYVATTGKAAARLVLTTAQDDPLLATWQYGLGRGVAWTSDATSRWARHWVTWDAFSRFWGQCVRWTIVERDEVPVEMSVSLTGRTAHIAVDAVGQDGGFINGLDAAVSLVGPDGEPLRVTLRQTAPGRYEGEFEPQTEGAYLMRLTGSLNGAEVVALTSGWVMGYSPEYGALEGDPAYLERLAALGGGTVLTEPAQAAAHTIRGRGVARDLWPALLTLAAVLLPVDVGLRRLALGRRDWERVRRWLSARLPRRRARPAGETVEEETPAPVRRLFQAKSRAGRRPGTGGGTAPPPSTSPPAPPTGRRPSPLEKPKPPSRPAAPSDGAEETLAGRLLRKKKRGQDG